MPTINSINSNIPIEITLGGTGLITITDHSVMVGSGTGAITPIAVGTDGQVLLGSSAADPVFATLTSTGGTITFTPGAGTLNLEAAVDLTPWNEAVDATLALLVNEGYVMNRATAITATLPATAAFGSVIKIVGKGAGLTIIAQNAGQTIFFGTASTTPGVGGTLTATSQYDCVELVCIVADTSFVVRSSQGNWSYA
jgi:hypothetical protein